jgi:putative methionine-R-sulfoxide reductase with GAF domain
VLGALTVLAGFSLFWYIIIPLAVWLIYRILHHYAASIPENIALFQSLLRLLYEVLAPLKEHHVRCTLLVPREKENSLIQLARYTLTGEGISKSKIVFGKGVAGQCFDRNETILEKIDPNLDFLTYMANRGFTKEEAKQFLSDRKSYLCVPIATQNGRVLSILSLDSKEYGTFTESTGKMIERCFVPVFLDLFTKGGENGKTK